MTDDVLILPLAPSINRLKTFDAPDLSDLSGELRVKIIVYKRVRSGDVDNRVMPVLNALKIPQQRIVYLSAHIRFSKKERTVVKINCCQNPNDRAKPKKGAASRR